MQITIHSEQAMQKFGQKLGLLLRGGMVLELVGDVGAGKTTLTKSIAGALGIEGPIQSPTFTICNRYQTPSGLQLAHYDFYRLAEAGIMREELGESLDDPNTITVIEWGDIVADILPKNRLTITITAPSETERMLNVEGKGALLSIEDALA
jgi:tRNA threonylcarbamoyladenosine biosynthesis protein TsaE